MKCGAPSCQTPEYPYSAGEGTEDGSGTSKLENEVSDAIAGPYFWAAEKHELGEQFGVKASLELHLKGAAPVQAHHRLAGWLENHVGELEHQIEGISPEMFLSGAESFLRSAGIDDVLLVSLNGDVATRTDEKMAPVRDDLETSISAGMSKLKEGKSKVHEVVVEAFGTNEEFEVQIQLRFRSVHPPNAPGIIVCVWALPHELMERSDESEFFYEDRVNAVLADKAQTAQLEEESRKRMEVLLTSYQGLLSERFQVDSVSREVKVDLRDITV